MKHIPLLLLLVLVTGCSTIPPRDLGYVITPPPKDRSVTGDMDYKFVAYSKGSPIFLKPQAELITICSPRQYDCQRFKVEVPEWYDEQMEGFFLPLVEADLSFPVHGDWYRKVYNSGQLYSMVSTTPTFIVWEGSRDTGHEIARFIGYDNRDDFIEQVRLIIEMYDLRLWE